MLSSVTVVVTTLTEMIYRRHKLLSFHLSISGTLIESWMDFTTRGIFGRRKGNDIFLFSYMEGFAMPPIFEAF
jgi:hypothetical protein